jgi:hypothetical protein
MVISGGSVSGSSLGLYVQQENIIDIIDI